MFLPLIDLLGYERLPSFPQYPLLDHFSSVWLNSNLRARWQSVNIFREHMVEKRRSALNRMRHFHPIPHTREYQIRQDAPRPDILRRVQGMPLAVHRAEDTPVWVPGSRLLGLEIAEDFRPRGEVCHSHGPEVGGDGSVVEHPTCYI